MPTPIPIFVLVGRPLAVCGGGSGCSDVDEGKEKGTVLDIGTAGVVEIGVDVVVAVVVMNWSVSCHQTGTPSPFTVTSELAIPNG